MSEKLKTQKGGKSDVKMNAIIDFAPLETKTRKDDKESWNSMQFYGESDIGEADYVSPSDEKVTAGARERILQFQKARSLGKKAIEAAMLNVA